MPLRLPALRRDLVARVAAALALAALVGAGAPPATAADRSPVGALDAASATGATSAAGSGAVSVRGWALDPDATAPIRVRVLVDGVATSTVTADVVRRDVARARPGHGARHGVVATVTGVAAGQRSICLVGVDVGPGSDRRVGCRTVTVPPAARRTPSPAPPVSPPRSPVPRPDPNPLAAGPAMPTWTAAAEARDAARASGRRAVAGELDAIASRPTAVWLGDWYDDATLVRVLRAEVASAQAQRRVPVFVLYAVPARDCGLHSAGGFSDPRYRQWSSLVADTLRGSGAAVVVEPDALALLGECAGQGDRSGLLRHAVGALADAGLAAYLDAGTSDWVPVDVMAGRLRDAGVDRARGFSTNVSNYQDTDRERAWAERLRARLGGTPHYVVDVSRNGRGWQGTWCNPAGAALGEAPRAVQDGSGLDALLWIKRPGESDGTCGGGPEAGTWSEALALALVRAR